jgi:hypothetical protein
LLFNFRIEFCSSINHKPILGESHANDLHWHSETKTREILLQTRIILRVHDLTSNYLTSYICRHGSEG